jgi:hypothetical protein
MNNKFLTGALIATAAIVGSFTHATAASAQLSSSSTVWNGTQPTIFSGADAGFDHTQFQQFVQQEGLAIPASGQKKIDANRLFLKYNHNVQVSFVNEGAGYRNQLAFTAKGKTNTESLLFNDISCSASNGDSQCVGDWGGNGLRLGDTVKTGLIKGGTQLDFSLRADGYNRGSDAYVFGTPDAANPDGLNHMIAYTYGSRYLILGFEDLFGDGSSAQGKFGEQSDRDFNDTIFVVDVGERNVACLNSGDCEKTPEPAAAIGLLGMAAAALIKRRQR